MIHHSLSGFKPFRFFGAALCKMGSILSTSSDAATSKKKNHDVYDATSRSVELPLHTIPSSLILADESQQYDESQNRVERDEIDFAAKGCASSHGFVLKDFFSAAECEALVAATEGSCFK
jgi:hypothetical protein